MPVPCLSNDGMSCPEMYPEVSRLCNEKPQCVGEFLARGGRIHHMLVDTKDMVIATDVDLIRP